MNNSYKLLILTAITASALITYKTSLAETITTIGASVTISTEKHQNYYSSGDNTWVSVNDGSIPINAVIGGHQSSGALYICRVNYNNSIQPGKLVAGKCNIGYGGKELAFSNFEILVGRDYQWVDAASGHIPAHAVIGGQQQDPSYTGPLYICHSAYRDGIHPGKLIAGKCNIGYGGQEISLAIYQVLTSY